MSAWAARRGAAASALTTPARRERLARGNLGQRVDDRVEGQ